MCLRSKVCAMQVYSRLCACNLQGQQKNKNKISTAVYYIMYTHVCCLYIYIIYIMCVDNNNNNMMMMMVVLEMERGAVINRVMG